jgi:hypothetical protein
MAKHNIEIFAKYAGLATVAVEWLALLLFYVIEPGEFRGENAISYFASLPQTKLVFSVCITLAAIFFWVFARYHLSRYYVTPVGIFTASMIGYGALALTPYDPSVFSSEVIHRVLAMFFSITFVLGIYLMSRKNRDSQVGAVSRFVAGISTVTLATFVAVSFTRGNSAVLPLEVFVGVLGQLWIVWISLHSFKSDVRMRT